VDEARSATSECRPGAMQPGLVAALGFLMLDTSNKRLLLPLAAI
jgi:hypothetical protein